MLVETGRCWSVRPSKDSTMVLPERNVEHQDMTGRGQPSCRIVWRSLAEETLSNAPRTSRKRAEVTSFFLFPVSTSCARAMAASIAERWGRPLIWSGCSRSCASAMSSNEL
jgi:hypothetical protein